MLMRAGFARIVGCNLVTYGGKNEEERNSMAISLHHRILEMEMGKRKMEKIVTATLKVRGTEKEIERVKARIASLLACEEVISLYIGQEGYI